MLLLLLFVFVVVAAVVVVCWPRAYSTEESISRHGEQCKTKQTSNTRKQTAAHSESNCHRVARGPAPTSSHNSKDPFIEQMQRPEPNWHTQKRSICPSPTERHRDSSLLTPSRALESLQGGKEGANLKPRPQKEEGTDKQNCDLYKKTY